MTAGKRNIAWHVDPVIFNKGRCALCGDDESALAAGVVRDDPDDIRTARVVTMVCQMCGLLISESFADAAYREMKNRRARRV